jgi:hypothetical protein
LSLRERNLGFIRAATNVLELIDESSWPTLQRELSDEQVARLHRISQLLWPEDTDLSGLLPRADDGRIRAVYMGPSDPRTVAESVIAMTPLFDQILVMDPFLSPRNIRPEFSPITAPAQHKQQFLKNVIFWLTLEPMIVAGKVVVFPDPGDVSPEFGYLMRNMALERAGERRIDPADMEQFRWLVRDDVERSYLQLPDETLLPMFRKASPDLTDEQLRAVLAHMRRQREGDPLALHQIRGAGEKFSQLMIVRSVNLEVALFVAQSTGAVIVTDVRELWQQLHLHTRASQAAGEASIPDTKTVHYRAPLDPFDSLDVAETSSAEGARDVLRMLRAAAERSSPGACTGDLLEAFQAKADGLVAAVREVANPDKYVTSALTASIPASGFESPTAQRLVVGFGRDDAPVFLGLAFLRQAVADTSTEAPPTADVAGSGAEN